LYVQGRAGGLGLNSRTGLALGCRTSLILVPCGSTGRGLALRSSAGTVLRGSARRSLTLRVNASAVLSGSTGHRLALRRGTGPILLLRCLPARLPLGLSTGLALALRGTGPLLPLRLPRLARLAAGRCFLPSTLWPTKLIALASSLSNGLIPLDLAALGLTAINRSSAQAFSPTAFAQPLPFGLALHSFAMLSTRRAP
jgi:hypothetical protein